LPINLSHKTKKTRIKAQTASLVSAKKIDLNWSGNQLPKNRVNTPSWTTSDR